MDCEIRKTYSLAMIELGSADGRPVRLVSLTNGRGLALKAMSYGAIVTELHVPDRQGRTADVALGLRDLDAYLAGNPYFGCTAGRCANRVRDGRFTLDGRPHQLTTNNGPHHLHGGARGFDRRVWDVEHADAASVRFGLTSPDGEEGYPGTVRATVTYALTPENEFRVEMTATTDAPTLVNLAHHTYWNLAGHDRGSVLDHRLQVEADGYTPVDATLIPTGDVAPVEGTPFDFRRPRRIGESIAQVSGGYDHNFALRPADGLRLAARLEDPASGRSMEIRTTEPGIQLYTGNFLDGSSKGKGGATYPRHAGLCLETQKFPDAANRPAWTSPVLRPGRTYRHVMVHRFGAR
jgi:aldose 1-epimerase